MVVSQSVYIFNIDKKNLNKRYCKWIILLTSTLIKLYKMNLSSFVFGSIHCCIKGCKYKMQKSSSRQYKVWPKCRSMGFCSCYFTDLYKDFGFFERLIKIEADFPGANVILHKYGKLPPVILFFISTKWIILVQILIFETRTQI
jgi:hypothetical protein